MPDDDEQPLPLSDEEEFAWRALARVAVALPRIIDADLLRDAGLTLTEYLVLMILSEAPDRSARMSELSEHVLISASGLTRLIERLERDGMVERVRAERDGRGQMAVLTDRGLERLGAAWPAHVTSVRRVVIDNLRGLDLAALGAALNAIVDENSAGARTPGPRRTRWI